MFPMLSRSAVAALIALTLFLTACGDLAGDSWAGLKLDPEQAVVYMAYGNKIIALNTADGTKLWEYPAKKEDRKAKFYAIPALDDGTLYIGDWEGRLHSVNTADGTANWVYEPDKETVVGPVSLKATDRVMSGVAFDGDKVFFGLGSENIVALSRNTAEEVWTFQTDHGVWGTPLYLPADPEQADGSATLYAVSLDHYLYAIDPETGDKLWSKELGGAAPGNMLYDAELNRIYVGTFASELVAVDLAERDIVARYETKGWLWGGPALTVDESGTQTLYFGDVKGYVYAVHPTDEGFTELWQKKVAGDAIRSTPLVLDDRLFVGSQDGHVYAVSTTDGSTLWDDKAGGEVLSEFISVSDDGENADAPTLVLVSTANGDNRLVAYQSDTGERAWRYSD